MGLEGSGWDILAWRVQILEIEPFDGFSVPCELWHFRFSGCLLVVACRPPILWYLWVLSEDLGSRSRLPHLEVFTLELYFFSCFCNLIIPSCIVGIQSLSEMSEWFTRKLLTGWSNVMLFVKIPQGISHLILVFMFDRNGLFRYVT